AAAPGLASGAEELALQAGALARAARTLDELRAAMEQFEGCALKRTAKQLVFADGVANARLMLVGEAPGAEEDRIGRPFVGRSGQLLDRMLAAIGHDRSSVFIANTVPWRPPGNRTPTPQESAICRPFIERQIELVNPQVLVCLGGPAAQALLGVRDGILRVRGRWSVCQAGERRIRAMPTLHPAYLLRSPLQKRLAWRDFLAVKMALDGTDQG
ncbi:uracil-DNA glycosylase family protein, partial [Camelimonas abortus]